jgi:hypothetical protein
MPHSLSGEAAITLGALYLTPTEDPLASLLQKKVRQ